MAKRSYPLAKVYGLIEPGPVVLLATAGKTRPNVMTLSWLMPVEFEPPLLACLLGAGDYSYGLLRKSRECSLNIPAVELAEQVVAVGNCSGREVDKFAAFGLATRPAACVGAPLLEACYASLECKVYDSRMANRYGLFILEVVKAWVDGAVKNPRTLHHRGMGAFMVAGETIRLKSAMK
ncbi:flavin reductase family protein [Parasulfuritortus cantonensis]|uniref:Flavin reductase family protein n=1 Tax=Parasulfuritortus cantonensis TaxID=2528202 RepID=A0A4R1B7L6_9PROT|nr:flavin reductase family protein [Parasulfuritortus cantonensis]TCJ11689.1 flavin reductase family protein [Parasulfuritortus cantonensis]